MIDRGNILNNAKNLTCGDRDKDYGSPVPNMQDIADGISWLLRDKLHTALTAADAAKLQVIVKLARMRTSPTKRDHYDDGCAYLAIAGECEMGDE